MKANCRTVTGNPQYLVFTGNYWAFTLTDGAHTAAGCYSTSIIWGIAPANSRCYSCSLHEFFGVETNLVGGWLGARMGLNRHHKPGAHTPGGSLLMLTVRRPVSRYLVHGSSGAVGDRQRTSTRLKRKSAVKDTGSRRRQGTL